MKESADSIYYNRLSSHNWDKLQVGDTAVKKNICTLMIAILIASPSLVYAGPGPGGHGGHGGPGVGGHGGYGEPHFNPAPSGPRAPRLDFLPAIATTLILGGLTYYIVNDAYYKRQGAEYILVEPPQNIRSDLNIVDYNNKRYYVRNGSYYQKDIEGNYIEVPRPAGL